VNHAEALDLTVSEVLAARPAAARVFFERRMQCVGCAFARFETVAEVARAYGLDADDLARALAAAADPSEERLP
jgi:hybrid cluster-associated redox disulfide protein